MPDFNTNGPTPSFPSWKPSAYESQVHFLGSFGTVESGGEKHHVICVEVFCVCACVCVLFSKLLQPTVFFQHFVIKKDQKGRESRYFKTSSNLQKQKKRIRKPYQPYLWSPKFHPLCGPSRCSPPIHAVPPASCEATRKAKQPRFH